MLSVSFWVMVFEKLIPVSSEDSSVNKEAGCFVSVLQPDMKKGSK